MKRPIILFLLCLVPSLLFSQKIFRDGYIIKNSGEKIEGLVEFITGKKVPSACVFKRFDLALEVKYTAEDISAFGFKNGSRYESVLSGERKSFKQTIVVKEAVRKNIASGTIRTDAPLSAFGIVGGLNIYTLKIKPETKFFLPDPDPEKSVYIGASYERMLSRRNDKFSLYVEAGYLRQTFYSYSLKFNSADKPIHDDAFIDFSALKVPVMLRYSLPGVRVTPYVNAGLSGAFFIDKRYLHIKEEVKYGGYLEINEDSDFEFRPFEIAAAIGAGAKIRITDKFKLSIEGRFELGNGLLNNNGLNRNFGESSMQSSLIIGICF